MTRPSIDVRLADWSDTFRERAELLARRCGVRIREAVAVEYRHAPAGTVVLQFCLLNRGRLLVGHHPDDWEWVNRLLAADLAVKGIETRSPPHAGR